ncbi:hypothetical protein BU15DRAFT_59902 [Melanogaster broomeanus]|nr:hypothetical protein BU15DRAFT_59902 [Melanogaster broomeanus]
MTSTSIDFSRTLEHSFVTLTAGVSLPLIIFAILTGQVGLYFWRKSVHGCDPFWIKGVIVCIWAMQAVEIAVTCQMTLSAHGRGQEALDMVFCEWAIYLGTCATTAFLVHSLFVRRIYLLRQKSGNHKDPDRAFLEGMFKLNTNVRRSLCLGRSLFGLYLPSQPTY